MSFIGTLKNRLLVGLSDQPRIRAAIMIVAALLVINFIFALGDARSGLVIELQQAAEQEARLRQILSQGDWDLRADRVRAERAAIEARFWRADSAGLVQAELQNHLEALARRSGMALDGVEFRPAVALPAFDDLQRIAIEVRAQFAPDALMQFLAELAGGERFVGVEGVAIETSRSNMLINLYTVFQLSSTTAVS